MVTVVIIKLNVSWTGPCHIKLPPDGQIHVLSRRALAALLRDDSDTDLCGWLKIAAVRAYAWTSKKELQGKIEN